MNKDYDVGYGRPPKGSQFKKGVSGNPKGRPKTAVSMATCWTPPIGRLEELTLQQAYRVVTAKIDGKPVEMSLIEYAIAKLGEGAASGNRQCIIALADWVGKIEARMFDTHVEFAKTMMAFKWHREEAKNKFKRRRWGEIPGFLQGDDIDVDIITGVVSINGPTSQAERDLLNEMIAERTERQSQISKIAADYAVAEDPDEKTGHLMAWLHAQWKFDICNDYAPQRYKAKLENRLTIEGASREGEALVAFQADDRFETWARRAWAGLVSPEELEALIGKFDGEDM
ncbi:DUF5681 domain-containing protein [Sphingomonas sp. YL-JM2C]